MSDKLNVAVTGFVGTGSSAIIDLLREFDNCGIALGEDRAYEHIPFYADNGLFDLGAILMNVNSSLRSDTAISSFKDSMEWLNNNNFGWFGSYKWLVGDRFESIVNEFISSISYPISGNSYSHYKYVKFSIFKVALQLAARIVYKRPVVKWGRKYIYDKKQMYFSMPTESEFYSAAKKFVNNYFEICADKNKDIMIYDHLLWPQQTHLVDQYFDKKFKMIIVKRDVRDLFTLNKHFWFKPPEGNGNPLFPTNPEDFIDYWKRLDVVYDNANHDKVLYVNFEDLVYKYDKTVAEIISFLGLSSTQHVNKKKFFDPEKSIKNTQTFTINKEWHNEIILLEKRLKENIYQFPYENNTSIKEMFS